VSDSDMSWTAQVVGGIDVALAGAVALYGEYRFTQVFDHDFLLGAQRNLLSVRPNRLVAGVRVGLR
jgi:hypothetical protein